MIFDFVWGVRLFWGDSAWSVRGAEGQVVIKDGRYHFGRKKKDPKEKYPSAFSQYACYYAFMLINQTDSAVEVKTMGDLKDSEGQVFDTVITGMSLVLQPGERKKMEGFLGVGKEDLTQAAEFEMRVDRAYAQ